MFLDNAASTQRPRQVIDVLRRVYEHDYANVHRGIHTLSERSTEQYEEAREKVRAFIGAKHAARRSSSPQGTTASINTVARSWGDANVRAGDEIVLTTMEHHSNLVPWQQLAERTGAVLRHIPITDDGLLVARRARSAAHREDEAGGRGVGLERAGHDQSGGRDRAAGACGRGAGAGRRAPKACRIGRPT